MGLFSKDKAKEPNTGEARLIRWATDQLSDHACNCDNCRSARSVLQSLIENKVFTGCSACGTNGAPDKKHRHAAVN